MKTLAIFLIFIVFMVIAVDFALAQEDPLFFIYQELKIGMGRQDVYDIVGSHYPGQMAKIVYEMNSYETWNWNWPPEEKKEDAGMDTAYLGVEFFNDAVSDAFYKHVSPDPDKIQIKRLDKPKS